MKKLHNNGFAVTHIIIVIVCLGLVAGVGYYVLSQRSTKENSPSTSQEKATSPTTQANDSEAQADINAVHAQLEYFFGQKGYYPSKQQLVSTTWADGLDPEALNDTNGKQINSEGSAYTYQTQPNDCTECSSYTLSTTLGDGSVFTKVSLN